MQATRILTMVALAATLSVSLLHAQSGWAPRLDPATAVTLEGTVVSFEPGRPSILVVDDAETGETVVRLGPDWYLDELGFTAAAGESVELTANECTGRAAGLIAIRIENFDTGVIAELREEDGRPAWRGLGRGRGGCSSERGWRGRGQGRGGRGCGRCPYVRG